MGVPCVLYNPMSCIEGRRRLPLPLLALGSRLPDADYAIVDANVLGGLARDRAAAALEGNAEPVLAVTVMPGNQLANALADTRALRARVPGLQVVWGGYFPSQHPDVVLGSGLVDAVVRGQGEETLVDWLAARGERAAWGAVAGLSWLDGGAVRHNEDRAFTAPGAFPPFPYHKIEDMEEYVIRTYLGERTLCHVTSRGCPFPCSFCAITEVYRRRWLAEDPERVDAVVTSFVEEHAIDAVEFFDANFMAGEARALAIAERLARHRLAWWCQARLDTMNGYGEATWRALARSGLRMMFFGAESGSESALARLGKPMHTAEILECAERCRRHGIVPEFSFVLGGPEEPEQEVSETIAFIRRLKRASPECEVLLFTYTPVPSRGGLFASAEERGFRFPDTLDEWASPRWVRFMSMKDAQTPWLTPALQRRIREFELVVKSAFPTVTDLRFRGPARAALRTLASWRWASGRYERPYELAALHRLVRLRSPELQGFDAPPRRRHRPPPAPRGVTA